MKYKINRAFAILLCFCIIVNVFFYCSVDCYASESEDDNGSISDDIWDNVHRLANVVEYAASQLGTSLTFDYAQIVSNRIAWDRVKENGGLIQGLDGNITLSEDTMNQIKEAIKEVIQDENGNDKYGMYLYESTSQLGFTDFLGVNAYYDSYYWQDRGNLDLVLGLTDVWFIHSNQGSYCNSPPAGSIWVCPDPSSTSVNFYHSGTLLSMPSQYYKLRWNGSNWEWYEWAQEAASAGTTSSYFGKPQTCFLSLEGARQWKEDGMPYTLVDPTYTGGNLVISPDQLHPDPDDPDYPGDDEDGDTSTELGVLQEILKYIKKIYHQLIIGNIISAVDAVAQVMDTAKNYIDEALEDVSTIGELAEVIDTKFPFSIPQDILLILTVFEAEPQTPVFEIPFRADFGGPTGIKIDEAIVIDFSDFDECIDILKWFMSIIWLWGLVMITPKFIDIGGLTTG